MTTPQSLITRLASPDATERTEADIQSDIKTLLTTADFDLDTPRLEEQIGDGSHRRIDIATGATVIEVKKAAHQRERRRGLHQPTRWLRHYPHEPRWFPLQRNPHRRENLVAVRAVPADGSFVRRSTFELAPGATGFGLIEWLKAVLATRSNSRISF